MKGLGFLSYFLGLEVSSNSDNYYTSNLLSQAVIINSKIVSTPLECNAKLTLMDDTLHVDPTLYCQLVGCLVYLIVSWPNIVNVVHLVNQFMAAPC